MHQHLEQQVAELLAQRLGTATVDGVENLVRLLEQVWPECAMGLLPIPGAAAGRTQALDHLVQRAQRLDGFLAHQGASVA